MKNEFIHTLTNNFELHIILQTLGKRYKCSNEPKNKYKL